MKFGIALLAIVPAVLATNLGYKPPKAFMDQHKHCQLPQEYHIVNFVSQTNSTGPSNGTVSEHKTHAAPSAYFFTFIDRDTQTMTNCHYKRSAKTTKSHGGLARYSCDNKDVDFTWHNKDNKLSVFQKVCPDREAGRTSWEVTGSVVIPLNCATGGCITNSTDITRRFTGMQPNKKPGHIRRHVHGVAWDNES